MKPVIIFDSQYGNTQKIAEAIARSLKARSLHVNAVNTVNLKEFDTLIVGSPTQGGRPTTAIQAFLDNLTSGQLTGKKVAAFDTRFLESDLKFPLRLLVKTIGYAAPKIAHSLKTKGGQLIAQPQGFIVKGKDGPLAAGELERASVWLKT